jgi:uncharacterized membrane protein YqjE
MTGPQDSPETRPVSVAELLAKSGTIGAPPVSGRRRRRRGNSAAVTVAELTGEIPIIGEDSASDLPDDSQPQDDHPQADADAVNGAATEVDEPGWEPAPESSAPPELAPEPRPQRGGELKLERSHYPRPVRKTDRPDPVGAEQMSPDPVLEDDDALFGVVAAAVQEAEPATDDSADARSYLRSSEGPLFSGQTVADDLARRRPGGDGHVRSDAEPDGTEALTLRDGGQEVAREEAQDDLEQPTRVATLLQGGWVVLQSILAVTFGAGLFIAFDQLWRWNNIVALVLSVLVILGLVVGVRVVRKTEDIASTLIAVAVGALVTLGPLALLQSN